MTPLFADTFYFIALLSPDDTAHERAIEYSQLIEQSVTTEWVLLELADGLASTRNRDLFKATRDALFDDPPAVVIPFDMTLHERAIELYIKHADKEWSLTDCVSFLVMRDRGLGEALTNLARLRLPPLHPPAWISSPPPVTPSRSCRRAG